MKRRSYPLQSAEGGSPKRLRRSSRLSASISVPPLEPAGDVMLQGQQHTRPEVQRTRKEARPTRRQAQDIRRGAQGIRQQALNTGEEAPDVRVDAQDMRVETQETTEQASDASQAQGPVVNDQEAAHQTREEEIQEPPGKPGDKRVEQAIRKFDGHGTVERDLWDTLHQLTHQQSQELSPSLIKWGRRGGLREKREYRLISTEKIFDPTANSFTLWPLPSQLCPTPAWSLEDELSALVTTAKRKMNDQNNPDDDTLADLESEDHSIQDLVDQNQKTLHELFNNLYEYHPPHSALIPIFTKIRRAPRSKSQPEESLQSVEPTTEGPVDFGLDWKFVLKVAESTLNINPKVLQRTQQRLCEMYRIPLENSALGPSYSQERKMKPSDPLTPPKDT